MEAHSAGYSGIAGCALLYPWCSRLMLCAQMLGEDPMCSRRLRIKPLTFPKTTLPGLGARLRNHVGDGVGRIGRGDDHHVGENAGGDDRREIFLADRSPVTCRGPC